MGTRIPPSLDFLVIYNKNLTALPATIPDDDDDAQEEAHILFYTSRERSVTKDRTLRQVGLAKALASFSEQVQEDWMFNENGTTSPGLGLGLGCETVHSTKSRLVMVAPEEHYTIHASVNLAYTVWTHKSKDGQSETRYQYHEESLHDSVLRLGLLKAYDEFRLLYGTFENLLSKGRNALQHKLDLFFTVWTHKWDFDTPLDFVSHLGVPIHPHTKHFAPLLQDLKQRLPPDTALLLLSPPYVLAGSPKPFHRLWSILPAHLMSLVPPAPQEPSKSPAASSSKLTASILTPTMSQSNGALVTTSNHTRNLPSLSSVDAILRANGTATINFLTTMPNVKKWASVLTFRQPSSSSSPSGQSSSATPPPPDQSDDKAPEDPPSSPTNAEETLLTPVPPIPLLPQEAFFTPINVHLEDPETRALRMRRAYHMSLNGTLFAMVLPPEGSNEDQAEQNPRMHAGPFNGIHLEDAGRLSSSDDIPQGIEYSVMDLLKGAQELQKIHAIIRTKVRPSPDGSSDIASTKNFIVGKSESNTGTSKVIVASPGWNSTARWLYESAEALRRDKMVSEQFSRTATSQTWYITKRVPTIDGEQDVHMEIGRKQSSLVDVDNDLASLVQRLDSQGDSL